MGQRQNRPLTALHSRGDLTEPLETESPIDFLYRHTRQTETLGVIAGVPLEGLGDATTRLGRRQAEASMMTRSARSMIPPLANACGLAARNRC